MVSNALLILKGDCVINGVDFEDIFQVIKLGITFFQYLIPFVLILWGSMDLFKAVTAGKEEEIKKKQGALYKRAIAAVIVFILPWAVVTVIGFISKDNGAIKCYKNSKAAIPSLGSNTVDGGK